MRLFKSVICLTVFGFCLYTYLSKQNEVTKERLELPSIEKEIHLLREENARLRFEIDTLENPERLMELAREGSYSHLRQPLTCEIVMLETAKELTLAKKDDEKPPAKWPRFVLGVKQ